MSEGAGAAKLLLDKLICETAEFFIQKLRENNFERDPYLLTAVWLHIESILREREKAREKVAKEYLKELRRNILLKQIIGEE